MDFLDLVHTRQSIRSFTDAPVSEDDLRRILVAIDAAPTAGNLQAFEVVVVTDPLTRQRLGLAAHGQAYVASAPLVLVFLAHPARSEGKYAERGRDLYALQDTTIACTVGHYAVAALGLGSVWIGAFDEAAVARAVHAPAGLRPIAMLAIGHVARRPKKTPRRGWEDFTRRERFSERG